MPDLRPKFITFDCYGTLTRFQMAEMAREFYAARLSPAAMEAFIRDFSSYRFDEILGDWKPYADVIKNALERTCRKHGVAYAEADGQRIYDAVPGWGPHPDVPEPLTRVGNRFPLVGLSNAADEQIGHNIEKMQAPFHAVFTAQQAQSYKPRMRGFEYMLDQLGARPEECMHVSSSLRYDHMTAYALGFQYRVLVNRGHEPTIPDYVTHQIADIGGLPGLVGL